MADDDRDGLLDSLLNPLMLPRRAVRDLEALGETARSLPGFERELMACLYDLVSELGGLRSEVGESLERLQGTLEGVDARVNALEVAVADLSGELGATKAVVTEVRDQVVDVVEHLPDLDSRGPIARARDAIAGNES